MNIAVLNNLLRQRRVASASYANTPEQFVAGFNALVNSGGKGGMTITFLNIPGSKYQTVNPVTVGSNVAGGQSPTGFLMPLWKNVLSPGTGSDAITTAGRTFGAPCTAEGYLRDIGLVMPSTANALINAIGPADPNVDGTTNFWPNNLFTDRGCGMTFFGVAKMTASIDVYQFGETGNTDTLHFGGDLISSYESLRDPAVGLWPGAQNPVSGGSLPLSFDTVYVKTGLSAVNKGVYIRYRFGRDLVLDQRPAATNPDVRAAGRNLYFLSNGGATINPALASNELRCLGGGYGRMNLAQTIFWNNWLEQQDWCPANILKDSRNLGIIMGNSFVQPWDIADPYDSASVSHTGHIGRGFDGAAALGNTALVNIARSGNWIPVAEGPIMLRWNEDCDFSRRTLIEAVASEWINNSLFQMNYDLLDAFRALAPSKIKIAMYDLFYGTLAQKTAYIPSLLDRLNNEAVQTGHADFIIHLLKVAAFKTWAWGNGQDIGTDPVNGQQPEYWGGQHPTDLTCKLWEQPVRLGFRKLRGDNIAGIADRIDCSAEVIDLDASTVQTNTPNWTAADYLDNSCPITGITFESRNTAVATVDAAGVITGRGTGRAVVIARLPVGAMGVIIVRGSGTAPIPTPTYTAIWDWSIPGNLYQDSARTTLVSADGQPIGSISDTTGNGNHGSQSTAGRRAIWKQNIVNGLGAALLTAASHQHWLLPQAISPNGPFIVFAAVNPDAALATLRMIIGRTFGNDEFQFAVNAAHKFFGTLNLSGGAKSVTSTGAADGAWAILEMVYDGATLVTRINGADVHSIAASGTVVYPNANDIFAIGAQVLSVDTPAGDYQGYIAEIRYIREQLIGATDLSTFRHDIAAKYAITVV
jgi:hypothetical protein